jgi:hypothetical protein
MRISGPGILYALVLFVCAPRETEGEPCLLCFKACSMFPVRWRLDPPKTSSIDVIQAKNGRWCVRETEDYVQGSRDDARQQKVWLVEGLL